jgi:hypothetical protein
MLSSKRPLVIKSIKQAGAGLCQAQFKPDLLKLKIDMWQPFQHSKKIYLGVGG